jgi:L-asparaginase
MSRPESDPLLKTVYVLTTGGTIEKVYREGTGAVENVGNKIDRYLKLLRLPECDVNVVAVMNKDSLEMTDHDRVLILGMARAILKEQASIVITHGTDTMVETGLYLRKSLQELRAPIVLTGAMTPLGFEGSDGLQNLTESFFAARTLSPGVYIVMHGTAFPIGHVRKDAKLGRFVWSDDFSGAF